MADNYLERKMEEHQARQNAKNTTPLRRKGYIYYRFPQRKVLLLNLTHKTAYDIATSFSNADCKVAIISDDAISGKKISTDTGARFIKAENNTLQSLEKSFRALFSAWGDVDIVITPAPLANFSADTLVQHRSTLPYPNSYGGRLILINNTSENLPRPVSPQILQQLTPLSITVNAISQTSASTHLKDSHTKSCQSANIARICIFLSLPENSFINGNQLIVNS